MTCDSFYIINIRGIRLRFSELQDNNKEVKTLRWDAADLPKG